MPHRDDHVTPLARNLRSDRSMDTQAVTKFAAKLLETAGLVTIVGGAGVGALRALLGGWRESSWQAAYHPFRKQLGRSILLGLELLVGADIVRTVAENPTLQKAAVLGTIVLIRTFLSFTLVVELEGRWPWQHDSAKS